MHTPFSTTLGYLPLRYLYIQYFLEFLSSRGFPSLFSLEPNNLLARCSHARWNSLKNYSSPSDSRVRTRLEEDLAREISRSRDVHDDERRSLRLAVETHTPSRVESLAFAPSPRLSAIPSLSLPLSHTHARLRVQRGRERGRRRGKRTGGKLACACKSCQTRRKREDLNAEELAHQRRERENIRVVMACRPSTFACLRRSQHPTLLRFISRLTPFAAPPRAPTRSRATLVLTPSKREILKVRLCGSQLEFRSTDIVPRARDVEITQNITYTYR